ncbi:MAG: tRNA lysidine(34) synthetase TilS [Bacteroidales bacterium]|nr:tRNA lysidine(34) synthetase TilS [Bacteroidales bacterium]
MVDPLQRFISENDLFSPDSHILLAVSGGIDSVVMTDLFYRAGYHFGIAHCNFQLRDKESQDDEQFVRDLAAKLKVPFFVKKFDTSGLAAQEGISIQMAARKLRYEWFEETRSDHHFDFIATAHHLDDQIETFFINLIRGTGIQGLHGIMPKKGRIIRPMLFTSRKEIETYAFSHPISWREDRSNSETKYLRNKIRIEILPLMKSINPDFLNGITGAIHQIRNIEAIWKDEVNRTRQKIIHETGHEIRIDIPKLARLKPLQPLAWELLSPYGFNETVIHDLLSSLQKESGKVFFSKTYRLIKNRDELILEPLGISVSDSPSGHSRYAGPEQQYLIDYGDFITETPLSLRFSIKTIDQKFEIPLTPSIASLNLSRLSFPLILRRWQTGDTFYPFGMNKKKKLSDFFIDHKFSLPDKENCWLLCSGKQIVWVIGYRIDHRFRITSRTEKILQVELIT